MHLRKAHFNVWRTCHLSCSQAHDSHCFAVGRSLTHGSFLLQRPEVQYCMSVSRCGTGLGTGPATLTWRNSVADKGQLVDYVALKKSVQITTTRKAVVSVASNLPRLWASTNVCVVRWQVRLWELKNSLAKTSGKIYLSVCSVLQNIHRKACASTRRECGNKQQRRRAGLPLLVAVLA